MFILAFLTKNEQRRPDFPPSNLQEMHGSPVLLDLGWMVIGFVLYLPKISPKILFLPKFVVSAKLCKSNCDAKTDIMCKNNSFVATVLMSRY